jgi:hypothetical protein
MLFASGVLSLHDAQKLLREVLSVGIERISGFTLDDIAPKFVGDVR